MPLSLPPRAIVLLSCALALATAGAALAVGALTRVPASPASGAATASGGGAVRLGVGAGAGSGGFSIAGTALPGALTVTLTLTPDTLAADGRSVATAVATLSPAIPELAVSFVTDGDAILAQRQVATDAGGRAADTVVSGTTPGVQTITAYVVSGTAGVARLTQSAMSSGAPRELSAPSVGIDVPIAAVDRTSAGAMDAPMGPLGDITWAEAFWLRSTSVPGDPGTAALAGHLDDTAGRPAAFWNLHDLRPGDEVAVRVDTVSGSRWVHFRVTDVHNYTDAEANSPAVLARVFGGPGDGRAAGLSHLSVYTCSGTWHRGSGYDHRFIAFLDRVDG